MVHGICTRLVALSMVACCALAGAAQADQTDRLSTAVDAWWATGPGATGVVVHLDGKVVYEAYRGNQSPETLMPIYSITKSVGSILIGIASAQGDIADLNQPIAAYFPDHAAAFAGDAAPITVKHVLTMTTGRLSGWHLEGQPIQSYRGDLDQSALALPQVDPPGTVSRYSTLLSNLVAGILESATRTELETYATSQLFDPLGITNWEWHRDDTDRTTIGAGLRLTTRDMARFGQLVLDYGAVGTTQLLPRDYVVQATGPRVDLYLPDGDTTGYGYLFWQSDQIAPRHFIGYGYAEQMVLGVFDEGLVVAVSAPCCSARPGSSTTLVAEYILPALADD